MTANFLSRIYNKIKCPLTTSIIGFTLCYVTLFLVVDFYTKSFDFSNTVLENKINSKMQQIAKQCGEDYYINFITLKSDNPKKFAFKERITWNKYSKSATSIKNHNPDYQKEYLADELTFLLFKNLPTGAIYFPTKEDINKPSVFSKILAKSNVRVEEIGISLVRYFNGNVRYVFVITSPSNKGKCSRQDITESLKQLVEVVEGLNV